MKVLLGPVGRWAILAVITLLPTIAFSQESKLPAPEKLIRVTKDGIELSFTYYGGIAGKDTIPVILVHDFKGRAANLQPLAIALQRYANPQAGFAVAVPDMRGHGASTRVRNPGGRPLELRADKLKRPQFEGLALLDLEVVKKFLMEKHNAGELNIDQLCVVGAGSMGSDVAAAWTSQDWSWPVLAVGKQGQDVKAMVFISPEAAFTPGGLKMKDALFQHPFVVSQLSTMIIAGRDEEYPLDLYQQLTKKHAPIPKDENQQIEQQDLFLVTIDTNLKGAQLLDPKNGLGVEQKILRFLELRVINKRAQWPWIAR